MQHKLIDRRTRPVHQFPSTFCFEEIIVLTDRTARIVLCERLDSKKIHHYYLLLIILNYVTSCGTFKLLRSGEVRSRLLRVHISSSSAAIYVLLSIEIDSIR